MASVLRSSFNKSTQVLIYQTFLGEIQNGKVTKQQLIYQDRSWENYWTIVPIIKWTAAYFLETAMTLTIGIVLIQLISQLP